jgi:DNA-directed RNA polymerase specialized sigma24 family protein
MDEAPADLIALDEALSKLAARDPIKEELVNLHYYARLTIPEAADVLGISTATAERC